jgi:hypothetical protein
MARGTKEGTGATSRCPRLRSRSSYGNPDQLALYGERALRPTLTAVATFQPVAHCAGGCHRSAEIHDDHGRGLTLGTSDRRFTSIGPVRGNSTSEHGSEDEAIVATT